MENVPFIDDFPIETSIYKGFSMAMLNNQMVIHDMHIVIMLVFLLVFMYEEYWRIWYSLFSAYIYSNWSPVFSESETELFLPDQFK